MKKFLMASVAVCAMAPAGAWAQSVKTEEDPSVIQEVVVTAQRRTETLQDVPLAVSALDGAAIAARGLTDVRDLLSLTPGATFSAINAAEPVLSIRGISSGGEGAASDAGALMMIDGEVIARDFLRGAPVYDVERVEVLRGPQGTTYGRNATAGVFHVISRKPKGEPSAEATVEIADYDSVTINAAGDAVLGAATAARLALHYQKRDGYTEDALTGRDIDYRDSLAGRLTLSHKFGEDVNLVVRLHTSRERHGDTGPLKSYDPTKTLLSPPFAAAPITEPSTDPYKVLTTPGSYFKRNVSGASIELTAPVGALSLTSLTAFRHGDNHFVQGSPLSYNNVDTRNDADAFSQELRLDGRFFDDRLNLVSGVFYIHEQIAFGFDRSAFPGPLALFQQLRQSSKSEGFGVFGEGVAELTPKLRLTVGGRYSKDKKTYEVYNFAEGPFAFLFVDDPSQAVVANTKDSWKQPTGRVSLDYKANDNLMAYATVSQGYKSGGFNLEPSNVEVANTSFDQETVTNVEVGVRTKSFGNRLQTNITVFDMAYDDIQANAFLPSGGEIITNNGKASIRGAEVELVARPSRYLTLNAGYARYDAKYDDYINADGEDLSGTRLAKSPKWTLNVGATLTTAEIGGAGRLRLRADYNTRSDVAHDAPADPVYGIRPGVDLVDLRLAWLPSDGDWEAAVFVRNALDKAEMQYIGPAVVLDQRPVIYGPPRVIGASLSYKFGR